jgi:hypothetical protein
MAALPFDGGAALRYAQRAPGNGGFAAEIVV